MMWFFSQTPTSQGCEFRPLLVRLLVDFTDYYSLLRMEGWNGTTSLSLSYCDGSYSLEEAMAFLQCMKEFMMGLAN